ncbi:hypothetical protein H0H87_003727 [Tephrocybe sp. NHM501043]|nr:hypothetical protein H0H87_003727 [Tephrocybe sp. NHM501043]
MSPEWFKKNKTKSVSPLQPRTGTPKLNNNDLVRPEATDKAGKSISSIKRAWKSVLSRSPTISHTPSRSVTPKRSQEEQDVPISLPGEWELDREFFVALTNWESDHPQSTLSKILQKVSDAIEKRKSLIDVIPDAPFPAQSLVKGLCQVLQLSASISNANLKLREFVLGVVEWITGLNATIASFGNEELAKVEWKNLAKVREIINEICNWAKSRFVDKRWTKLNMDNEIAEFETLVQKARQSFTEVSLIRMSGNIFRLHTTLQEILRAHKEQELLRNLGERWFIVCWTLTLHSGQRTTSKASSPVIQGRESIFLTQSGAGSMIIRRDHRISYGSLASPDAENQLLLPP